MPRNADLIKRLLIKLIWYNLSVFRISFPQQLSESAIWQIGQEHVQGTGNPIKARADLLASAVYENSLEVIPDEPPPRHAISHRSR